MSLIAKSKSLFARFVSSVKGFFGFTAEDAKVVPDLAPAKVTLPAPAMSYHQKTKRIPGKARPAGSKLARKAAQGTVGKAVIR